MKHTQEWVARRHQQYKDEAFNHLTARLQQEIASAQEYTRLIEAARAEAETAIEALRARRWQRIEDANRAEHMRIVLPLLDFAEEQFDGDYCFRRSRFVLDVTDANRKQLSAEVGHLLRDLGDTRRGSYAELARYLAAQLIEFSSVRLGVNWEELRVTDAVYDLIANEGDANDER